jgi:hypothetical protein
MTLLISIRYGERRAYMGYRDQSEGIRDQALGGLRRLGV